MTTVRVERSSTGVPGLDEVLHGSLICKRFYRVDGDPGAGKTTLALQCLDVAPGTYSGNLEMVYCREEC